MIAEEPRVSQPKKLKDTVALQMLYFLKIKIFISLDSCQFVEYLFKIKIYIFQFLKTKKGDKVSFVYFYQIIYLIIPLFEVAKRIYIPTHIQHLVTLHLVTLNLIYQLVQHLQCF